MTQWIKCVLCVTSFWCFVFSWLLIMLSIFACPIDHLYVYFVKCPFKFCQLNFFLLFKWIVWATYSVSTVHAILPREHTGHSKHPHPTTKEMAITRWSTLRSDGLHSLQPKMDLYTLSKNKTRSWLWLRSWTPYCKIQTEIEESRENH